MERATDPLQPPGHPLTHSSDASATGSGLRRFRRGVVVGICVICVALGLLCVGVEVRSSYCVVCLHVRSEKRIGVVAVLPRVTLADWSDDEWCSSIELRLLGDGHVHQWRTSTSSRTSVLIQEVADGRPRAPSRLQIALDSDERIQRAALNNLDRGTLTPEAITRAILFEQERADGDEAEYTRVLRQLGMDPGR